MAEYRLTGGTAGISDYDTTATATGSPEVAAVHWEQSESPPNGAAAGSGRETSAGTVGAAVPAGSPTQPATMVFFCACETPSVAVKVLFQLKACI